MALELFCWGPSLNLLRNSPNGALWLERWFTRIVGIVGIACITDQFKSPIAVKDTPSFIEGKCPQQQNGELL